ncbi:hypothetical protein N474_02640 [Pseudoalteromonas luteoviolacea CPMOR-2]|uniref:Protein kinase domain-containing protein n=1 Tax=Pseudoalteromonas luteoviolacea DSM 6061 TaxID=1365250 RepID=A0A166V6Y5_9GAMM|nr:protein kinase [Pseudoalteromonas luteoviolacea]KZN31785.1 hypothetical protein N475_04820 [Pseudoalteromonas luteoviolacea DSM 6061]KZN54645.1 hypothetical protein N474_02640 [Pseudoalteromonas luteoviolacea CPMOR-2]MBE0389124.1 serine/threonine-protein kinase PpkA [Pseudoalteromonas luteoviolacea DSM 6061]
MLIAHSNSSKIQDNFFSNSYKLLEKIGQGGFGEVYKATQVSTGQLVAIKFLRISSDLEEDKKSRYIARFHREIDLISRLHHPNIVHLIDRGKCDGGLIYAVYEYIDGQSLKDFLASNGPLSALNAADVMAGVLDALAHAHAKGVIHRDIKPANIMLLKAGAKLHVKVLDFGIGSLVQEARKLDYESITLTQETLGTPAYSAPEQLRGEPPVSQTDIYVWGLVFLECLTGETVMRGSSLASIFHQQLSPANIPLDVLAGHDSASLMRRVLDKKVDQRPKDAVELYKVFRKINFANLVGTLAPSSAKLESKPVEQSTQTIAKTLTQEVSDTRFGLSYTRLAERKQVTILCIILGCEPINGAQDGAQDVIDTLHADQLQQCIDIATRFGAYHVGTLGDTLVFYFGYPRASDSDSRLSARAALEVVSRIHSKNALLKLSHGIVSHLKMGMETGSMVSLANNMPEGRAAHNAIEMARCANSGQIVCSKNVKQLLDAYINFELVHM